MELLADQFGAKAASATIVVPNTSFEQFTYYSQVVVPRQVMYVVALQDPFRVHVERPEIDRVDDLSQELA